MSFNVLTSEGEGFVAPSTADFWHPLFGTDGSFAITRPMILALLSVVVLVVLFTQVAKGLRVVPGKGQFFMEQLYNIPRNAVGRDMIGENKFRPFIPLLVTLFTLILLNNIFAIVPVLQYPTMSRFGFPVALTAVVYLVYLGIGFGKHGPIGFFKKMVPAGVPAFVVPLLMVLEIITYFFTRPLTLALRLFANMFAGHMLLMVFILGGEFMLFHGDTILVKAASVPAFLLAIVMTFFELLVQFLQAYVFTLLAGFYIADALSDGH